MSEATERVLQRLEGVRRQGGNWEALCPAHEDRRASLSIKAGPDGRALVYCHAGCPVEAVVAALGLDLPSLFDKPRAEGQAPEATYDYVDEEENLLFQVVRFWPKDFRQRTPKPEGGWDWSLNGVRRVLYRLPLVRKAAQGGRVIFVVEGEKDADNLIRLGLTATTNPGGAGKWREDYVPMLSGAHLVILPDNDEIGQAHAEAVARLHLSSAKSVRILFLPGLPPKGDVSDWLLQSGSAELLKGLVQTTPRFGIERRRVEDKPRGPLNPEEQFRQSRRAAQERAQLILSGVGLSFPWGKVNDLVGQMMPGQLIVLGGRAKQGKSTFLRECFEFWVEAGKRVILVGTEQAVEELRALWACQHLGLAPEAIVAPEHQAAILQDIETRQYRLRDRALIYVPDRMDLEALADLTHLAAQERCDAVIFDHFTRLDLAQRRSKWEEQGDAIKQIKRLARTEKVLVVTAAQLTDGDGGFGQYDVPTGSSWAYTRELQRECDVGAVVWRPLKRAPTNVEVVTARTDESVVSGLVEPNVMAFRVVAHRLRGASALAGGCRLYLNDGRISGWIGA